MPTTAAAAEAELRQLPGVTIKTEFGNRAFWVADTRFAAATPVAVLLRLPAEALTEALLQGARPFVSAGAMGRNGWVEIRLSMVDIERLRGLIASAHEAALHSHRRSAIKKPSRARHIRPKRSA